MKKVEKRQLPINLIIGVVALVIVPILAFILMEFYGRNPFEQIRPKAMWFNIFLFELIAWFFFAVTGRARMALRLELVIAMVYGLANTYVVKFRTNPIVPWDIFSWRTAASVATNYDLMPSVRMVVITVLFVALLIVLQWVDLKLPTMQLKKKPVLSKENGKVVLQRGIAALLVALVLGNFAEKLQDSDFQTEHYLYPFLFTPTVMTKYNGLAVTFTMDLAYMEIEVPEGYDRETMATLLGSYEPEKDEKNHIEELPNIIVIMNEAFSDMASVADFVSSEDYMPFMHELQQGYENTISGDLQVSVCGGNTANSEFEFLTGNTMAFLPQGSIPYQQYIDGKIDSIPAYLQSLGYETVATHPYNASGWERDEIYPLLGFERSIFKDEYVGAEKLRSYISDDACVDKIIELYEKKESGTPLFVFNVTMQNHGGYTDEFSNFTPDITVEGVDNLSVEQYLSLLKVSDASLEKLVSYFETQEEKTILVFFGDHQPNDAVAGPLLKLNGKDVDELTEEEVLTRYETPYVIWANYDIEEEVEADTSLNYLGGKVLETAGITLPAYQSFLKELSETYPIITSMQVQTVDKRISNASEEEEGLLTYQSLQYYQLFEE